jgi:hypothetical protein
VVVDDAPDWIDALAGAGIVPPVTGAPDVAVSAVPGTPLDRSRSTGAAHLVFDRPLGAADRRRLRTSGFALQTYVVLPRAGPPELWLPVGQRAAVRYGLGPLTAPPDRARRARNRLVGALLGRGLVPPGVRTVTVASRSPGPPWVVATAAARAALEVGA